jgi:hypothetical protein
MKENHERIWKWTGDDNWTPQDDQFCTIPVIMMGQHNLLGGLSNRVRCLSTLDHTLCPKRVNLLYSKPLSEYSLLPVNKHFQTLIKLMQSYALAMLFHIGKHSLCDSVGITLNMLYFLTILYWLLYMSSCTNVTPQKEASYVNILHKPCKLLWLPSPLTIYSCYTATLFIQMLMVITLLLSSALGWQHRLVGATQEYNIKYEVFTIVLLKIQVFWAVTCQLVNAVKAVISVTGCTSSSVNQKPWDCSKLTAVLGIQ